jgi:hypothetical protein
MDAIRQKIEASLAGGHPVAHATIVQGPGRGREMLIWPAGEIFGSVGSPRLNQRISLFAEAQFGKGWKGRSRKRFDHGGEQLVVEFVVHQNEANDQQNRRG